jgi:hypothetical protein
VNIKLEGILLEEGIEEPHFICIASPVFLSFYLQFPVWFPCFSHLNVELHTMFLLPHFKGSSWCFMVLAMEGKKGVAPSFNLERNHC